MRGMGIFEKNERCNLVGIELHKRHGSRRGGEFHNVRSVFPKNLESLRWWLSRSCGGKAKSEGSGSPVVYLSKERLRAISHARGTICPAGRIARSLDAKVIKEFNNPISEAEVGLFRASLRNAQAEWLAHGRKTFQEKQQKNGKTMNGMDTAKGHGLNPLNCKYSEFVDSCVDRLNRMLRNGETTKEAVNTAKHYLYALKSIAAAKSGKLTRDAIEGADCVDSYNALLKQLAQSGELTASGPKASQPKSGAETTSAPSAGGTPSIAARFLRRFLAMHGKTFDRSKASTLLRSLQRAIVGKEIRKTDRNAELIEQMQSALIRMLDGAWGRATVEFDAETLAALQKNVNSEKQSQTVTLLRAYVGLNDTNDRAKAARQ